MGDNELSSFGKKVISEEEIYERDLNWILDSDVIIAEVSIPSLGVGYEIGIGIEKGKKILCLYKNNGEKRLSAMIAGCSKLINRKYENLEDLKKIIEEFFNSL